MNVLQVEARAVEKDQEAEVRGQVGVEDTLDGLGVFYGRRGDRDLS